MAMASFTPVTGTISTNTTKRVKAVSVRVVVVDCTGTVWATDLQLQSGPAATGWSGHVSELKWSVDE